MKTIAIFQPYLWPYLGYFQIINLSDVFIILDDVNFIKKGWINRNQIQANGKPLLFTAPLQDSSQHKKINEILIHPNYQPWKEKFLKTLEHSYKRTPNFKEIYNLVQKTLDQIQPGQPISWLATNSILQINQYLDIPTKVVKTSSIYNNSNLKGQERIINLCHQEKATHYVNAIGGDKIYSKEKFKQEGVELKFHKMDSNLPFFSIIDVLMFYKPCEVKDLFGSIPINLMESDWNLVPPQKVVIFGTLDIAQLANYYLETDTPHTVVGFTVNKQYLDKTSFEGKPVVPFEELESKFPPNEFRLFAPMSGAGMNKKRETVYLTGKQKGYSYISYVSSKATRFNNKIGENCFILENNTLQPFTNIGNNVVMWSGSHIGHHSAIQDHSFFTSHVVLSGHCTVEPYTWLGVNSTIRDGLTLAEGTLVGMSACVTKNTEKWSCYLGVPAKKIDEHPLDLNP